MTTYCRYHCSRCSSHFTSLVAFDAHHEGSGETHVPCQFPDDHGLTERTGVCKIGAGPSRRDVTVYEHKTAQGLRDRIEARQALSQRRREAA